MARIFRHPEVEDYFHVLDLSADACASAQTATELYEAGQVVVLKGSAIDFDREFLATVEFDEQSTKKFKSINFLKQHEQSGLFGKASSANEELLRGPFGGDRKRLSRFADQVRHVNSQVDALVSRLFPSYRIERPSITWRLNETINENLHVDVYREDLPGHHLRVFVNLDVVPRIWHLSHTLEHLMETSLHLLPDNVVRDSTPGRLCYELNFAVFKGFKEAGREGQPKHIVFFDPGEVWFADSRKVSHQIFFGRKALSTEHVVANESMRDPSLHYYEMINRSRDRLLGITRAT